MLSKNLCAIIFVVCAFLNGTFAKYQFLQSFSAGLRSLPFHGGDFNILNLASFGARKKFNEISKALLVGSSFHYFTHKYKEKLPGLPATFSDVNASFYKKVFKDFCVNCSLKIPGDC